MMPPIPPLLGEPRVTGQTGIIYSAADVARLYRDDDRSIEEKYGKAIAPRFDLVC